MKKIIVTVMVLFIVFSAFSMFMPWTEAETSLVWSEEIQLTFGAGSDYWPSIACSSTGRIWLVFTSDRSGKWGIYIIYSDDGGITWTDPRLLVEDDIATIGIESQRPHLFIDSNGVMWLSWHTNRSELGGDAEVWYILSTDEGVTWSTPRKPYVGLSPWNGYYDPYIAEAFGKIWIFFGHLGRQYVVSSSDGGASWSPIIQVTPDIPNPDQWGRFQASAILLNSELWLVYSKRMPAPEYNIFVTKTVDGNVWTPEQQVTSLAGMEWFPSIACDLSGKIYIFFDFRNDTRTDVLYTSSVDAGLSWSTPELVTADVLGLTSYGRSSGSSSIVIDNQLWVVYSNNYKIKLKRTLISPLAATIDVDPNTLNLKSKGKWITCYIELSEDHDVNDINVSTVMLNDTISAELHPTEVGDYDGDGIPDLMVKFNRAEVIGYVLTSIDWSRLEGLARPYRIEVTLVVAGKLYADTPFEGYDTIYTIFGNMPTPR